MSRVIASTDWQELYSFASKQVLMLCMWGDLRQKQDKNSLWAYSHASSI